MKHFRITKEEAVPANMEPIPAIRKPNKYIVFLPIISDNFPMGIIRAPVVRP